MACLVLAPCASEAQSLRGSLSSVDRQYKVAQQHDFTFLETAADVGRFVKRGLLVPVPGSAHAELADVSYPYARPAVRTFVDRLAAQYESACGERLVITSLTRPAAGQPRNASGESVHPAGMAVDLRVSHRTACRGWLHRTLLSLERRGVLEATREQRPPHFHVAVFPDRYLDYLGKTARKGSSRVSR